MRKIISLLFLLLIVFALSACSNSENDDNLLDGANISDVENVEKEDFDKERINTSNMITVEGFLDELPKIIDLDYYTYPYINENETFCMLYDFYAYTKVDFDYKIALENAEVIQLPQNYSVLVNEGWVITDELVDCELYRYAEPSTGKGAVLDKYGKQMTVMVMNNSDQIMQLKDCDIETVRIITTTGYKYETGEDIREGFGFTICDNITHDSTIENVFEKFGAPQKISISENLVDGKHSFSIMEVEFRTEDQEGVLTFKFVVDENKIISIEYQK
ncbi:MAG: hypothetical protein E7081_10195 [Bacteroidales bacterium]|nr:hypothetical protein [Bacteroidales bacterium]